MARPSGMVVSLSYRHALDQIVVSTRLRGSGAWRDPLASPGGFIDHPRRVRLRAGALRGDSAQIVLSPHGLPHLWALSRRLVITIAGDLDRGELLRIASSLGRAR